MNGEIGRVVYIPIRVFRQCLLFALYLRNQRQLIFARSTPQQSM